MAKKKRVNVTLDEIEVKKFHEKTKPFLSGYFGREMNLSDELNDHLKMINAVYDSKKTNKIRNKKRIRVTERKSGNSKID